MLKAYRRRKLSSSQAATAPREEAAAEGTAEEEQIIGEPRWPMAGAVITAMALIIILPGSFRLGPPWLLPASTAVLLVAQIVSDPGKIDRRSRQLRILSIVLIGVLVLSSAWSTFFLIKELIEGGSVTNEAGPLLAGGVMVWIGNDLAFALLFWELDCGGAAERAYHMPQSPDFGFPQQLNPEIAPRSWRPRFVDYLYLSLTNSIAFSPTDAMPLAPWAKTGMAVQSLVSFSIVGLVIARAVNVFS